MSRFPYRFVCASVLVCTVTLLTGCMYQQPMYQPGPYGQQMYGAPGGYAQPGTMVIPQSNIAPYPPGSVNTYDSNTKPDDFEAERGSSDGRFFGEDGGVPPGKDPGPDSGDQRFNREFGT